MPKRTDVSDKLIHFTKGDSMIDAFNRLRKIMSERRLLAGNYKIRGGYQCVCFTEAPLTAVACGFLDNFPSSRYAPFGLMFAKSLVFAAGGRPVIYQSEPEFMGLPEESRWRHVRYEPLGENPIDFTWEREWRIRCEQFRFRTLDAEVVVPTTEWIDYLMKLHRNEQDVRVELYSHVFDEDEWYVAEQLREKFRWRVVSLFG